MGGLIRKVGVDFEEIGRGLIRKFKKNENIYKIQQE